MYDDYNINTSNYQTDYFKDSYKMQNQETYESESKKENKKEIIKDIIESNGNTINDLDKELLQNQTIKELEKYNKELKDKCDNLEESNEKEIKKSKQLEKKVEDLEKQLNEEKKKNENLEEKNKNLEKELENAKKNQNSQKNESSISKEEKDELVQRILNKDNDIAKLRSELDKIEKDLISIIFINEEKTIHYSLVVKCSEKLNTSESRLMDKYPEEKDNEYDYYFKEKRLNKNRTYKESNLDNGSIITLKKRD